jgi:hypothetical protein
MRVTDRLCRWRTRVLMRAVVELVLLLPDRPRARMKVAVRVAAGRTPTDWLLAKAGFDRRLLAAAVLGEEITP